MHIAFLTTEFPIGDFKSGGIGTSIRNLAPQLLSRGIKVTILFWGLESKEPITTENGILIIPIPRKSIPFIGAITSRIKLTEAINKIVKEYEIDIVEVADWEGNYAFGKIQCPVVMRMHCSNLYFGRILNKRVPYAIKFLERRAVRKADAYIACSKQVFDVSNIIFDIDNRKPFDIIYNIVNQELLLKHRKPFSANRKIIFYGTVVEKKGVYLLPPIFNAIADKYSDAELFVVGKDTFDKGISISQTIYNMVDNRYKSRFHIVGPLPYDSLLEKVAECEICLLPSKAEGMPLVLIEGMMLQKCVVTSNIPCLQEVSTNGVDVMQCNVEDTSAYINAITRIFDDELFAAQLSKNAANSALSTFSKDSVIAKNIEFYKRIIYDK